MPKIFNKKAYFTFARVYFLALIPAFGLVLGSSGVAQAKEGAVIQCKLLPDLFKIFLMHHYEFHALTSEIENRTVEQMIQNLDPSKTLFLQEDVSKITSSLLGMFKKMKEGDCRALMEANAVLLERAKENEKQVAKVLGPKYKVDESVEFQSNPKKRSFPKSKDERDELTKKLLHFQVQNYLLTDVTMAEAKKSTHHRYELMTKRISERKMDEMLNIFLESFAVALDPHSSYLSRDNLEDFQIQMSLSLEGIGATLGSQDGYTVVEDIVPGGAADRAKVLEPKDKIIAVAQEGKSPVNVIDMELQDVVKLIRGKKGTKVILTILRSREKTDRHEFTIVRDKIDIKDQAAKITFDTKKAGEKSYKIATIELPSFYGEGRSGARSSFRDVKDLVKKANDEKADALILNLTRNGGGLLEDAVNMSGLFIGEGGVVATQNTQKDVDVLEDDDSDIEWAGPLLILTSRLSASASEILAGALKDYGRAIIVGDDHTFGKGTVQAVTPLPPQLGAMKITTGMYFLPKGVSTQHIGVTSDITLPSAWADDDVGEKTLDYSLKERKIDAFLSPKANNINGKKWKPVSSSLVEKLRSQSKARIDHDSKFADIKKELEDTIKNKGIIKLADIRKKSEKDSKTKPKDKSKTQRQIREEKKKDSDAPYLVEASNIIVDWLTAEASK